MAAADAIQRVLGSRKTWQVTASGILASITSVITLWAALQGWPSEKTQTLILAVGGFITAIAAASGPFLAVLTAGEDIARKLWITTPQDPAGGEPPPVPPRPGVS